jgi:cytochrome c biogenesis protein
MATTETELASATEAPPTTAKAVNVRSKKSDSILDKVLRLLSSVKFGLVMLSILLLCCMIGMLVMQVNVDGFQKYYTNLKPAQKMVYGALGFFDIYRRGAPMPSSPFRFLDPIWPAYLNYFQLLLSITGLNIILASIDRFPTAWQYIRKPKLTASPKFIAAQAVTAEGYENVEPKAAAEKVRAAWRKFGFRGRVTEEDNRLTVFAQRNNWNRLGAYVVHVALLTIFTGGFLTSRYGLGGSMEIKPGKTSNKFITSEILLDGGREGTAELPFQIECTDLKQMLIREEGTLDNSNTIDWLSYIRINDRERNRTEDMVVHLNNVGDYRGYRFFQNSFVPVGNARTVTIGFEPTDGGPRTTIKLRRPGSAEDPKDPEAKETADVPGIGTVRYVDFLPDFGVEDGKPVMRSREYNEPAAQLQIVGLDGTRRIMFAFRPETVDQMIVAAKEQLGADGDANRILINGNKVVLRAFEKVALTHTLTIQYDPGRTPVYLGFTLLVMALCGVFFFSHQRVWAVIEPDGKGSKIHFGGNTNRNKPAFEGRFNTLVQSVTGGSNDE